MSLATKFQDDYQRWIAEMGVKRQNRLGKEMVAELKKVTGVQGTPETPSHPGEPPKKQSGKLYNSFMYTVSGNVLKVFTTVPYAKFLEESTRRMAERPFFWNTINAVLKRFK